MTSSLRVATSQPTTSNSTAQTTTYVYATLLHRIGTMNGPAVCNSDGSKCTQNSAEEFKSPYTDLAPIHPVGQDPTYQKVRTWIGISMAPDCSNCPTTPASQSFQLTNLVAGKRYWLVAHLSYLRGNANYVASLNTGAGEIKSGGSYTVTSPTDRTYGRAADANTDFWRIMFIPSQSSAVLTIRLDNSADLSKPNYLYSDYFDLLME